MELNAQNSIEVVIGTKDVLDCIDKDFEKYCNEIKDRLKFEFNCGEKIIVSLDSEIEGKKITVTNDLFEFYKDPISEIIKILNVVKLYSSARSFPFSNT